MRDLWTGTRNLIRCEICYLVNITRKSFQLCSACGDQPLWTVHRAHALHGSQRRCRTVTNIISQLRSILLTKPKLFLFSLGGGGVQWTSHHVLPKHWYPSPTLQVVQPITSQAETPTAWKNIKLCTSILCDWQKQGNACPVFILRYMKDNLHHQLTTFYIKRIYSVIQPQPLSL